MAAGSSLLRGFLSLFLLLFIHIGHASCCFSPGPAAQSREEEEDATDAGADGIVGGRGGNKRRKISPLAFSPAASSSAAAVAEERVRRSRHVSSLATSLRFYLHRIFSSAAGKQQNGTVSAREEEEEAVTTTTTTVSLPQAHVTQSLAPQPSASLVLSTPSSPCASSSPFTSPLSSSRSLGVTPVLSSPQTSRQSSRSFAARGDVFPCKACGEVLDRAQQLELHHATKHSLLSELSHLDSSTNIIRMIFLAGWTNPSSSSEANPTVRRVLKIHHTPRALARFEEYRDLVRARAQRRGATTTTTTAEEQRCIADGNERLRFHCSTTLCGAGGGACGSPYCRACSTARHGFAGKQADVDGVATYASAWAAHAALPGDVEQEFAFLQVRRAMLVCRVVAGRVGRGDDDDKVAYDSLVPAVRAGAEGGDDVEELLVFNPRAVLPCFVIIYGT
ncbi:hypothetical protein PR202_gb19327 [Eleusine coracana subsp. coracana]|uniref:C2H2-type domain-containing protein n=1 Tax=Eleusine coracana subsp. coracana TaxID=191504 RepID=A0AAV5F9Q2_ELECO|nr:hypothetical protein QOZ80_3BG0286000 [Eleusine coracana subsp. coracana]GJN30976.1 hypothetical protein PR202_gb19327 [Eleusine coracana subsp. coracana]